MNSVQGADAVRKANGVRAPANQRPQATRKLAAHDRRKEPPLRLRSHEHLAHCAQARFQCALYPRMRERRMFTGKIDATGRSNDVTMQRRMLAGHEPCKRVAAVG